MRPATRWMLALHRASDRMLDRSRLYYGDTRRSYRQSVSTEIRRVLRLVGARQLAGKRRARGRCAGTEE